MQRKVRINAVTPGAITTPLTNRGDGGSLRAHLDEYVATAIPMGRWGTADGVARTVLFLAGEDASYVTGSEIVVDGGLAQT